MLTARSVFLEQAGAPKKSDATASMPKRSSSGQPGKGNAIGYLGHNMSGKSRRSAIIRRMDYFAIRRSTFLTKTIARRGRKPRVVRLPEGAHRRKFADAIEVLTETVRAWDRGECQPNSRLRRRIHIFALSSGVDRQVELFGKLAADRDRQAEAKRDALLDAAMARAARTPVDRADQVALF
jgi:DNA-binding transcriptional regulator YiaG